MRKLSILLVLAVLMCSCSKEAKITIPKTLLFSPITPEYLQDTAADWKATGFDGFLISGIMKNWADDIWAVDGDSSTRGEDDQNFQRVKACNDECRKHGITDNFVKVAFYKHVPVWTDDAAWGKIHRNFREAARFAKMTGCRGIALDIEYVGEQYDLDWEGYDYQGYTQTDLREAAMKRGQELMTAMLESYPEMVFLNLPEGIHYYGPLAADIFIGMIKGMTRANAPGGLHLLTEHSYSMTNTTSIIYYVQKLEADILKALDETTSQYWREKCSIALGGWPLGYYREMLDEDGNFMGYGGHKEKFGDRIIGSYSDKSSRFSPGEFRSQYAGLLLGSKRYCWIYGHGATWWQFSEEDTARYGKSNNAMLPVDEQLDQFKAVLREKWLASDWVQALSQKVRQYKSDEIIKMLNLVEAFQVIGPFGCKDCDSFDRIFPPEKEIDFTAEYTGSVGPVRWQTCSAEAQTGYLNFLKHLKPTNWVCAYAYCKIISPKAMTAQIRLGTNDTGTLWFNGEKILSKNLERTAELDSDILPVQFKKGENTILIKVCNTEINWGLYLRITDVEGNAPGGLKFSNNSGL